MKYYDSIEELPLYNWRKITEKGDLTFCRMDQNLGKRKLDKEYNEKIQDSFLAEFGLSKDYERLLEIQTDIAILQCDMVIEDNRFLQNKINVLTRELEDLQGRKTGGDMDEAIHYIETWRGFAIDERVMTVRKFYKLRDTYKKEVELRQKASKNG